MCAYPGIDHVKVISGLALTESNTSTFTQVRTLRAELKRVQQTRCGQAGGTSSPSISLAVSAASASLPAAITPPRFLQ